MTALSRSEKPQKKIRMYRLLPVVNNGAAADKEISVNAAAAAVLSEVTAYNLKEEHKNNTEGFSGRCWLWEEFS